MACDEKNHSFPLDGRTCQYRRLPANAGSAVAIEPRHGKMVNSYGHPEGTAIAKARAGARHLYRVNVKLPAATNVTGHCAVGFATHGKKALVATALGRKSFKEAQSLVLEQLVKAGGTTPKIIALWKG
jgi:hypothetical protein